MTPTNEVRRERTAAEMAIRELRVVLGLVKAGASTVEIIARVKGSITATEALLHAQIVSAEDIHPGDLVADLAARRALRGLT